MKNKKFLLELHRPLQEKKCIKITPKVESKTFLKQFLAEQKREKIHEFLFVPDITEIHSPTNLYLKYSLARSDFIHYQFQHSTHKIPCFPKNFFSNYSVMNIIIFCLKLIWNMRNTLLQSLERKVRSLRN